MPILLYVTFSPKKAWSPWHLTEHQLIHCTVDIRWIWQVGRNEQPGQWEILPKSSKTATLIIVLCLVIWSVRNKLLHFGLPIMKKETQYLVDLFELGKQQITTFGWADLNYVLGDPPGLRWTQNKKRLFRRSKLSYKSPCQQQSLRYWTYLWHTEMLDRKSGKPQ